MELGFYKINGNAVSDPTFATDGSACFDLRADLTVDEITGFYGQDLVTKRKVSVSHVGNSRVFSIPGEYGYRWMIPTGLIFDIPVGYHLSVHMRGGTGLKRGLRLANGTGIVDDDYTKETFLLLQNLSGYDLTLEHNERLCQARLVKNEVTSFVRLSEPPSQKTQRAGGFNSTGRQ